MVLGVGLECIRHSKYTSSPSLMLDAFKLWPKRSSAWGASEVQNISNNQNFLRCNILMFSKKNQDFGDLHWTWSLRESSNSEPGNPSTNAWQDNSFPWSSGFGEYVKVLIVALFSPLKAIETKLLIWNDITFKRNLNMSRILLTCFPPTHHEMVACGLAPMASHLIWCDFPADKWRRFITNFTTEGPSANKAKVYNVTFVWLLSTLFTYDCRKWISLHQKLSSLSSFFIFHSNSLQYCHFTHLHYTISYMTLFTLLLSLGLPSRRNESKKNGATFISSLRLVLFSKRKVLFTMNQEKTLTLLTSFIHS